MISLQQSRAHENCVHVCHGVWSINIKNKWTNCNRQLFDVFLLWWHNKKRSKSFLKAPSNVIHNHNVDPLFSASNQPMLTLILHNEASEHNKECNPGGHLWRYKTGPLSIKSILRTPSEIADTYTESTSHVHVSSYQLQCLDTYWRWEPRISFAPRTSTQLTNPWWSRQ